MYEALDEESITASVSSSSNESVSSHLAHGAEAGSSQPPHFDVANHDLVILCNRRTEQAADVLT
jgi:hypothetical protein